MCFVLNPQENNLIDVYLRKISLSILIKTDVEDSNEKNPTFHHILEHFELKQHYLLADHIYLKTYICMEVHQNKFLPLKKFSGYLCTDV